MDITFAKMHGLGNDFIVIDCRDWDDPAIGGIAGRASHLCDRRFGIGADQILLLCRSEKADFAMKIFNADGSEVEMCGNGIRCLARYIWDRRLSGKAVLDIETPAGIIRPERAGDLVLVDMGEPVFEPEHIPVNITASGAGGKIVDYPLPLRDREFRITCLSMGNPHAVIFIDEDLSGYPVPVYGPLIERHPLFPRRTNVEFVRVDGRTSISMRVWERGAGETLACGTGASAAGVASMLKGLTERTTAVHLPGGELVIVWRPDNRVTMTGPAVEVFVGTIGL